MQETRVWYLGQEDLLEKGMATHSRVLAWEIPWTEEPGKPQPMGWQKSQTWLSNSTTTFPSVKWVTNKERNWIRSINPEISGGIIHINPISSLGLRKGVFLLHVVIQGPRGRISAVFNDQLPSCLGSWHPVGRWETWRILGGAFLRARPGNEACHIHPCLLGQNLVTWPHSTARESGKYS